jgi:glycosyltransferase involved in cell wall biosynthesis
MNKKMINNDKSNSDCLLNANNLFKLGHYLKAKEIYSQLIASDSFYSYLNVNIEIINKRLGSYISEAGKEEVGLNNPCNLFGFNNHFVEGDEVDFFLIAGRDIPFLSVVIPAYNVESFISKAVEGILENSKIPLEILIVDDGSTDSTPKLLKELATIYPNVFYKLQKNSGAGIARNAAIPRAKGRYTYFFDADDELDIKELSDCCRYASEVGADLVFFRYIITYPNGSIGAMYPEDVRNLRKIRNSQSFSEIIESSMKVTGFPWNRIIKTCILKGSKIEFGTKAVHNDILFHWSSISNVKSIKYWDGTVCNHRKFDSGTLSSDRGQRRIQVFSAINEVYERLADNQVFISNKSSWVSSVNKMLSWNQKIINVDCQQQFTSELDAFKLNNPWFNMDDKNAQSLIPCVPTGKPLVSIITITWNVLGEGSERDSNLKHFTDMFRSVAVQDYGRENIEHVVVDGLSSDGTKEIIQKLKASGQVDSFISEKDSGIYNAMNKGVNMAKGDFILFLNAHDKIAPNAVSVLISLIQSQNADFAFGDSLTIDENDSPTGQHIGQYNRVVFGMPFCHQAAIFSKETFSKVIFPEDFRITTWKYVFNLFLNGFRYAYTPGVLAYFRIGGVSTSEASKSKFLGELKKIKMEIATKHLQTPYSAYQLIRSYALSKKSVDLPLLQAVDQLKDSNFTAEFRSMLGYYFYS